MDQEEFLKILQSAISEVIGNKEELQDSTEIKFPKPIAQDDMEARQQLSQFITEHPQLYKICCGCDAIVKEHVGVCPQCLAYRFENDPKTIVAHAFHLATKVPTETFNG